jgi:DNA-binding winged helix-turn-helix (wHTH) protein
MQLLQFGDFSAEIDASQCRGLFRGQAPVGLSDVPRRVLFLLLHHRPHPVLAKLLLKELWHPGANASNIAKQVRALRAALGDSRSQRYIMTVKKEGYAFVMPVTESTVDAETPILEPAPQPSMTSGTLSRATRDSPGKGEWRLAREKLIKDFRGSCLHDLELLEEAIEECTTRIRLIAGRRRLPLEGRFPHEPLLVPPRREELEVLTMAGPPGTAAAAAAKPLLQFSRTNHLAVNVGAYAPACLAVLQSLRRRFGLETRAIFEDLTGRQQVLRLFHDDEADFLFAPHAPLLLMGDHGALDYRWLTPVHAYEQVLLQVPGAGRGRRRKLLVYKGGSPEEQLLAGTGIPPSAVPAWVASLESLVAWVPALDPGDMVLAWEPLASGLQSKHRLSSLSRFRLWQSLYCHKRWQRGALRALKDQFRRLFASEWIYCRSNPQWAIECLAMELRVLEFFTAGSGLRPGTTSVSLSSLAGTPAAAEHPRLAGR